MKFPKENKSNIIGGNARRFHESRARVRVGDRVANRIDVARMKSITNEIESQRKKWSWTLAGQQFVWNRRGGYPN